MPKDQLTNGPMDQWIFDIFWHLKTGTFGKSACFQVPKMALRVPQQKNGDHFLMPASPQNGDLHICFVHLSLLGGQIFTTTV